MTGKNLKNSLRKSLSQADDQSDYPQTAVSHIVRTQHLYFAQRDTTPACFGPFVIILKLKF